MMARHLRRPVVYLRWLSGFCAALWGQLIEPIGVLCQRFDNGQMRVEQATLFQNQNPPVLDEYRSVLSGVFRLQFGLSPEQLDCVFAGAKLQDLKLH